MSKTRLIVIAAAAFVAAGQTQAPPPLLADPQHFHEEIRNDWVEVLRNHQGPHDKVPMHTHPDPGGVVVFLTDQNVRQTLPDGTTRVVTHKAGEVIWSPGRTHAGENLNNAVYEEVEIEPRIPAGHAMLPPLPPEKMDAVTIDPKRFRVEYENEYVRVIRARVGPNEKPPMHKHPATNAVVVYLTNQDLLQFHADGTSREAHNKAGQVKWIEKDDAHQDQEIGGKGFELIRVELKQSR